MKYRIDNPLSAEETLAQINEKKARAKEVLYFSPFTPLSEDEQI